MKKTILITGSTDGIGKLTAIKLAKEGHIIYLHGRNSEKLYRTIDEIKEVSKNNNVSGFVSDFSDLDSVASMSKEAINELDHLDILINNAGIFKSPIQQDRMGIDIRFTVNYLAPYLLTNHLISLLQKGTNPKVINLSSAAQSPINIPALKGHQSGLTAQDAYAQSKLALTMWTFDISKKFDQINFIAVNPGSLLNTKMANEAYGQFWSSADKGVAILYDLTSSEKFKDSSGKYFDNDKGSFNNAHPDAYDIKKINLLITTTNTLLNDLL